MASGDDGLINPNSDIDVSVDDRCGTKMVVEPECGIEDGDAAGDEREDRYEE